MIASRSFLYTDFGTSGTWMWSESAWTKISTLDPQDLVAP